MSGPTEIREESVRQREGRNTNNNRRISLTIKLHFLVSVIILVLSLLLTLTGYRQYCKKVDSYNYAQTRRFAGSARQFDDLTMLCLEYKKGDQTDK